MSRPKLARRIGLSVIALVLFALVAASILAIGVVRQSFPQTEGELSVEGLTGPVQVQRDARGIPTIYADNAGDLFRAQGYVNAQDRFFEMDYRRHLTAGRLSELVGSGGLEADKVIRTMGWRRVAEQELPRLAPETRQYLQASLAWLKAMAWDLRGDYDDELARARLSRGGRIPVKQINLLYPPYPFERNLPILSADDWKPAALPSAQAAGPIPQALRTASGQAAVDRASAAVEAVPATLGKGEDIGSNSWVVSGSRTTTGKPLLANDPHLSLGIPSIWSQVNLQCRTVCPGW